MALHPGSQLEMEQETASPRGGRPRDDVREQAICDAAIALCAGIGYEAMSMEAIAAKAGVAKTTIYRRWSSKAELVAEAMRRMHDEDPEPQDSGSLRGDLLALANFIGDRINGIDGGLMCGLAVALRADAQLGQILEGMKREHTHRVESLIVSRAKARGEISPAAEPPQLTEVAVSMTFFHSLTGNPLDEEFVEYLVDKILIPLTR